MNKLWQRVQDLFKKETKRPSERPFLHTAIESPLVDTEDLAQWSTTPNRNLLYTKAESAHTTFNDGLPTVGQTVQFIKGDGIGGCVIYCRDLEEIDHREYLCMLEEHKRRLTDLRYIENVADIKSEAKLGGIQKTFRFYLKPSMRLIEDGKSHQLFGNITLQFVVQDGTPLHYRITANTYNDHKYHSPKPFGELMEVLWSL